MTAGFHGRPLTTILSFVAWPTGYDGPCFLADALIPLAALFPRLSAGPDGPCSSAGPMILVLLLDVLCILVALFPSSMSTLRAWAEAAKMAAAKMILIAFCIYFEID